MAPNDEQFPSKGTSHEFKNTYSLMSFCGIDIMRRQMIPQSSLCMHCRILSQLWCLGFNNAAIHHRGENSVLEEWLWDHFGVLLPSLLQGLPELNLVEIVWNAIVQHLKTIPLEELYHIQAQSSAIASMQIQNGSTQREVASFYHKAGIYSSMLYCSLISKRDQDKVLL